MVDHSSGDGEKRQMTSFLATYTEAHARKIVHRYLSDHFTPVIISMLIARISPTASAGCHVTKNQRNQSWSFLTRENISNMNNA